MVDPLAGSCYTINYFSNTMCMDDAYDTRKLTSSFQAAERGGHNARCFNSSFKAIGATPDVNVMNINFRCYNFTCASTGSIFVKINDFVLICRTAGQEIAAPPGFEGKLRCPSFKSYCQ